MRTVFWCSLAASTTLVVGALVGWHFYDHPSVVRARATVATAAELLADRVVVPGMPARPMFLARVCRDVAYGKVGDAPCISATEEVCETPPVSVPAPTTAPVRPLPPEVIDLSLAPEFITLPRLDQSDEPPLAPEVVPVEHATEPAELPAMPHLTHDAEPEDGCTGIGEIPTADEVLAMPHMTDECPLCATATAWAAKARPYLAWAVEQDRAARAAVWSAAADVWTGRYSSKHPTRAVLPCKHVDTGEEPQWLETPEMERAYPSCPDKCKPHHSFTPASHEEPCEETHPCHPEVDTMEYRDEDRHENGETQTGPF